MVEMVYVPDVKSELVFTADPDRFVRLVRMVSDPSHVYVQIDEGTVTLERVKLSETNCTELDRALRAIVRPIRERNMTEEQKITLALELIQQAAAEARAGGASAMNVASALSAAMVEQLDQTGLSPSARTVWLSALDR